MSATPTFALPTNLKLYPVVFLRPGPRHEELSDLALETNVRLHANHLLYIKQRCRAGDLLFATPIAGADAPINAMGVSGRILMPNSLPH